MKINRTKYLMSNFRMKDIKFEKEPQSPDMVTLGQYPEDLGLMERPLVGIKSGCENIKLLLSLAGSGMAGGAAGAGISKLFGGTALVGIAAVGGAIGTGLVGFTALKVLEKALEGNKDKEVVMALSTIGVGTFAVAGGITAGILAGGNLSTSIASTLIGLSLSAQVMDDLIPPV